MFKDKFNKAVSAAKQKVTDTMNSDSANEAKEMFSALGKEGIVGGLQESIKAGLSGQDVGAAFQNHLMNWKDEYKSQKMEQAKQEAAEAFQTSFEEELTNQHEKAEE